MSSLQLFDLARARGLSFTLVGPARVRIDGPRRAVEELNDQIDANAASLIAIVEEFASDPPAVSAAMIILRGAGSSRATETAQ